MRTYWFQEFSHVCLSYLVPHLIGLHRWQLIFKHERLTVGVAPTQRTAACPLYQRKSSRIHIHYEQTLTDLPWGSRPIRLRLHARRIRCGNRDWPRAEQWRPTRGLARIREGSGSTFLRFAASTHSPQLLDPRDTAAGTLSAVGDIHASEQYRRHLVEELALRAVRTAAAKAKA
jgi:hypothetical protein